MTIHIPGQLHTQVDARAKGLGVSRNRFILRAIEELLTPSDEWPSDLIEMLRAPKNAELVAAVDEITQAIGKRRRGRKSPPKLGLTCSTPTRYRS